MWWIVLIVCACVVSWLSFQYQTRTAVVVIMSQVKLILLERELKSADGELKSLMHEATAVCRWLNNHSDQMNGAMLREAMSFPKRKLSAAEVEVYGDLAGVMAELLIETTLTGLWLRLRRQKFLVVRECTVGLIQTFRFYYATRQINGV